MIRRKGEKPQSALTPRWRDGKGLEIVNRDTPGRDMLSKKASLDQEE